MKSRKMLTMGAVLGGVVAGSYLATLTAPALFSMHSAMANNEAGKTTPHVSASQTAPLANLSTAFKAVHHAIENVVVNIHTVQTINAAAAGNPLLNIPLPFRNMLPPGQMQPLQPQGIQPQEKLEGTGSGVIVTSSGYIVTNNHVVQGAQSITVRLRDHRSYPAKVVGVDPKTDLAVIKINAKHLTHATFGNSRNMHVGDWVLAFGSPFGFSQTMTQGIISAKGRDLNIITEHNPRLAGLTYEHFLQTDAAINPGNSGGPLVNLKGHVIGIDSAIASSNGGFNGLGFAIPSHEVEYIMHQLIKHGKVVRGYMGVGIASVSRGVEHHVAASMGYKTRHGVLVTQILPGSPAARGGLHKGDIITALNGRKVVSLNSMRDEIAMTHPGTQVRLQVFRKGHMVNVSFPVGTQPNFNPVAMGGGMPTAPMRPHTLKSNQLGITVRDMTPVLLHKYGIKNGGVQVIAVNPNGLAASAGIAPGDAILSVQGQRVGSVAAFNHDVHGQSLAKGFRMSLRGPGGSETYVFVQKSGQ